MRSLFLALLAASAACAPARGRPAASVPPRAIRIAVLPAEWATTPPVEEVDASAAMATGLESVEGVEAVPVRGEPDPSHSGVVPSCSEAPECLRSLGRDLETSRAVEVRLASLGDTVLVRINVLDVAEGTREQTRQAVVRSATPESIAGAVERMGAEVAGAYAPRTEEVPAPWYRRWWVWVAASTVLAGSAALAVGLTLGTGEAAQPDVVITPPLR